MEQDATAQIFDQRLARRLKELRAERGWTLDELATRTAVSRATLSRLENAEVSPTASVLGRLSAAYGLTLSRLLTTIEETFPPLVPAAAQAIWVDPETGFRRRIVSPPAGSLAGEAIEGTLPPGQRITYARPPRPGLEHHLLLLEGALSVALDDREADRSYALEPGDCLRYQLFGKSAFTTPAESGARYVLFVV